MKLVVYEIELCIVAYEQSQKWFTEIVQHLG